MTNDTPRRYRRFLLSPDTLRIIGRVARERRASPSCALEVIVAEWVGQRETLGGQTSRGMKLAGTSGDGSCRPVSPAGEPPTESLEVKDGSAVREDLG